MGTGASKAKRDARKQATRAYYKALKETQRMKEVGYLKSNSAREIDDATGGSLDYSTKRKAMQADKLAREINKAEKGENGNELNEKIGKFNSRYDMLQKQLKGESVKRYVVQKENTGQVLAAVLGTGVGKDYDAIDYFSDQQSADLAAVAKNDGMKDRGIIGIMGGYAPSTAYAVKEEVSGKIDGFYRNFSDHKNTFDELKQYANTVNNSQSSGLRKRYGDLAVQIRAGVAKNTAAIPQSSGILGAELASSKPVQEVIS